MEEVIFTEDQIATVEAAAEAMIPGDEFDEGVLEMSPGHVIATRARYQADIAQAYLKGLKGMEESARIMCGESARFVDLSMEDRTRILKAMWRDAAPGEIWHGFSSKKFYVTLRNDVCFIYMTDPEVCSRIGFLGKSALEGGYPDYDQPQS
jgi:hypothetical protein